MAFSISTNILQYKSLLYKFEILPFLCNVYRKKVQVFPTQTVKDLKGNCVPFAFCYRIIFLRAKLSWTDHAEFAKSPRSSCRMETIHSLIRTRTGERTILQLCPVQKNSVSNMTELPKNLLEKILRNIFLAKNILSHCVTLSVTWDEGIITGYEEDISVSCLFPRFPECHGWLGIRKPNGNLIWLNYKS